jgi:hypothetical protein
LLDALESLVLISMVGGFETLRASGSPCTLTGSVEAIVNTEVPPCVASFPASATLIPVDKLDPE